YHNFKYMVYFDFNRFHFYVKPIHLNHITRHQLIICQILLTILRKLHIIQRNTSGSSADTKVRSKKVKICAAVIATISNRGRKQVKTKIAVFGREDAITRVEDFARDETDTQVFPFIYHSVQEASDLVDKAIMCDVYL